MYERFISLHPCQNLVLSVFFILDLISNVRCLVAIICISLMANDIEPLFICLFPNHIALWWTAWIFLSSFQLHFSFSSCWVERVHCVMNISLLMKIYFANISCPSVVCLFHSLYTVIHGANIFNFNEIKVIYFHGVCFLVGKSDNKKVSKETKNRIWGSDERFEEKQNEDNMPHTWFVYLVICPTKFYWRLCMWQVLCWALRSWWKLLLWWENKGLLYPLA